MFESTQLPRQSPIGRIIAGILLVAIILFLLVKSHRSDKQLQEEQQPTPATETR